MSLKSAVVVLLSLGCALVAAEYYCTYLNNQFINANNLLQCVLQHSENATFCLECPKNYSGFLSTFNDLIQGNDSISDYRLRFIDNNQLDIVESAYGYSKLLWNAGFCSGKIIVLIKMKR